MESLLELLTKKKPDVLQASNVHFVTNAISDSVSPISIWNITNRLIRYHFSFGSIVKNLKERQRFSDQMNRNRFDLTLAKRYWDFFTIDI